jgi:Rap1a immunity proteins
VLSRRREVERIRMVQGAGSSWPPLFPIAFSYVSYHDIIKLPLQITLQRGHMKTIPGILAFLLLLSLTSRVEAQDKSKLETKDGSASERKEQSNTQTQTDPAKQSEDSELTPGEKARAHELERYLGQAYINSQSELVDQLFSPDWRGFRSKDTSSVEVHAHGASDGEVKPGPANTKPHNFKSGSDLLHDCQEPQMSSAGICAGYILGVLDALAIRQNSGGTVSKFESVCFPSVLDGWQIANVVKKYLVAHPEAGNLQASQLVLRAALKTWGCATK